MTDEIKKTAIEQAAARIAPHVRRTPVIDLSAGTFDGAAFPLTLKLECLQVTASFKPRGAFNRMLSAEVPAAGVIAASGGNHGIAVAHAAKTLGHRAEIFVPEVISPAKVSRLKELGAAVSITGKVYGDALAASQKRAAETGALVLHAYDQPEILAIEKANLVLLVQDEGCLHGFDVHGFRWRLQARRSKT